MRYKFTACGHANILGTHKTTLEFTKDGSLSLRGDCIVGVGSDFDLAKIKEFINSSISKKIIIRIGALPKSIGIKDEISAEINPSFSSGDEFVVRKTSFVSERTFAINANKSAFELDRSLVMFLKDASSRVRITLEFIN